MPRVTTSSAGGGSGGTDVSQVNALISSAFERDGERVELFSEIPSLANENSVWIVTGEEVPNTDRNGIWTKQSGVLTQEVVFDFINGNIRASEITNLTGFFADGESHPLSERFTTLAEAQEVYPAAEALTDETDWAAIQSALDQINSDPEAQYGGEVVLPAGTFLINKTLWMRGPSVKISGAGQHATWIEYTEASGHALRLSQPAGRVFDKTRARDMPVRPHLEDLTFANYEVEDSTAVGFSSITPSGGQGFWRVLYLSFRKVDFVGFDVGVELTNTPVATLQECAITGRSASCRFWKADSFTIIDCDINGTFVRREGNQIEYDNSTNLELLRPTTFVAAEEVLSVGGPQFAGMVIGGELGHCGRVLYMEGGNMTIENVNIEDVAGVSAFHMISNSNLAIRGSRLTTESVSQTNDNREMVLLESTVSAPAISFLNNQISGKDHPFVRVIGGNNQNCRIISDRPITVEWGNPTTAAIFAAGNIKPWYFARSTFSDTDAGNRFLLGESFRISRSISFGEDFITAYEEASGLARRSSLINNRLINVLGQQLTDVVSTNGNFQVLKQTVLPVRTLLEDGDRIVMEASGSFAANGDEKGLIIRFLGPAATVFDVDSTDYNGQDWSLTAYVQRTAANLMRVRVTLSVDGLPPVVRNFGLAYNNNGERTLSLESDGGAGDVTLTSCDVYYQKGVSNR